MPLIMFGREVKGITTFPDKRNVIIRFTNGDIIDTLPNNQNWGKTRWVVNKGDETKDTKPAAKGA